MPVRFYRPSAGPDPGRCQPGLVTLLDLLIVRFPGFVFCGCYEHGDLTDGGTPSFHGVGRAIDLCSTNPELLDRTFDWLVANAANLGLNEVIAHGRIWRADNPAGVHAYTANQHNEHVHLALNLDGAAMRTPFFTEGRSSDGSGDDDMTPEQDRLLRDIHEWVAQVTAPSAKPGDPPWVALARKIQDLHEDLVARKG